MDLFQGEKIVGYYRQHRPTPPPELREHIVQFVTEKLPPPLHHAVDVGCGSGQSTGFLADDFDHVTGVDVSAAQIQEANKAAGKPNNVSFELGSDVNLPFKDSSIDLITVAMAIHWFDLDKFYKEVERVLRPNGCLALLNYNLPEIVYNGMKSGSASDAYLELYDFFIKEGHSDPRHRHVYNNLSELPLPYHVTKRVDDLHLDYQTTLLGVRGRLLSSSSYQAYEKVCPDDKDFLNRFISKLLICLGNPTTGEDTPVTMRHKVTLLMARKS